MPSFSASAWLALTIGALMLACGGSPAQDGSAGSPGSGGRAQGSVASGGMTSSGGAPDSGGAQAGGTGGSAGVPSSGGSKGTDSGGAGGTNTGGGTSGTGGPGSTGGRASGGTNTTGGGIGGAGQGGAGGGVGGAGQGGTGGGVGGAGQGGAGGKSSDAGSGSRGDGSTEHSGPWQMMTLGDSITETTCYPQLLSQELSTHGRTNFTFVGTRQANQGCGGLAPVPTEGHGGYLVTYLTSDSHKSENKGSMTELLAWAAERPEVVLMEYGTNDCWTASIPISDILSAYGFVLEKFRANNPKVIFFVAKITPLNPAGCSTCESRVESLNAQIPSWAADKTTTDSPVYVVDVFSALDPKTYLPNSIWTQDGCHPLQPAAQLMADEWYAALTAQGLP